MTIGDGSERDWQRRLAAERLRLSARWIGVAIVLSGLLPYEIDGGRTLFLWQSMVEMPLGSALAAIAPILGGLLLIVASLACRQAKTLAGVGLTAIVTPGLLILSSAPWSGEVDYGLAHRSAPSMLAIGLCVAGVHVSGLETSRRIGRSLLALATVLGIAYFVWPWPHESVAAMLVRLVDELAARPARSSILAGAVLLTFAIWPLLTLLFAWIAVTREVPRPRSRTALGTLFGLPAILFPVLSPALLERGSTSRDLLPLLGEVVLLGATLAITIQFSTFLFQWGGPLLRDGYARKPSLALLAVASVTAVPWLLAQAPHPPTPWHPRPTDAPGDHLFGELIPAWNDALAIPTARGSSRPDVDTRAIAEAAKSIDEGLAEALDVLLRTTARGDLIPRSWDRLIADVNERSRRDHLPYYVDPTEIVARGDDADQRWFRLDTYRIERTRQYRAAHIEYTILEVRWMTPNRTGHQLLGLSRDVQSLAVVVLDEIDAYATEIEALASKNPARCDDGRADQPAMDAAMLHCGTLLAELVHAGDDRDALQASVERHELQHQMDGSSLPRAEIVRRRIEPQGYETERQMNRELSAYLAQMAAPGASARMTLVRLLRLILLQRSRSESLVARLAFEALVGHRVDAGVESVAQAFEELSTRDDANLRRLAGQAWRAQYGRDLEQPIAE